MKNKLISKPILKAEVPNSTKDKAAALSFWDGATVHTGIAELRAKRGHPVKIEAEFFLHLPYNSFSGMLVGLDVPTRRQPELGVFVIDQKDVTIIDDGKVGNQMLWRRGRLGNAEQFGA